MVDPDSSETSNLGDDLTSLIMNIKRQIADRPEGDQSDLTISVPDHIEGPFGRLLPLIVASQSANRPNP